MEDEMRVKQGCFAGCSRRVGTFFRRILIKRRRKNKVSPGPSKTSTTCIVSEDTTVHRSTDGKSPRTTCTDDNIAENSPRSSNGKSPRTTEGTVADDRPTSSKGTSQRLTESDSSHVSGEAQNDSARNDGESGLSLETFVENYVKGVLEGINSMFLVNQVDELNKIDEDESTKRNAEDTKDEIVKKENGE